MSFIYFSNIPFLLSIIEYGLNRLIDFFKVIGLVFNDSLMLRTSLLSALLALLLAQIALLLALLVLLALFNTNV